MRSNNVNYQKELEAILGNGENLGKRLFLHSCCAPCSSYVLTYLSSFFDITVFYFNPNITDTSEYTHRVEEQKRLIDALNSEPDLKPWDARFNIPGAKRYHIDVVEGDHDTASFYDCAKGYEDAPEGGARCAKCFRLRLKETARRAYEGRYDFFGTTLTISPMKNAPLINNIGIEIAGEMNGGTDGEINERPGSDSSKTDDYALMWMPSDFKKKEGYKHSIELSAEYNLYRQNFCGCEFSKRN